jgi:hypothetical protein
MADPVAAPAAPATPTPAASAPQAGTPTPAPQAGAAPLKPHHSTGQPRTEVGTFDKKAEAPQFVELDGKRLPVEEVKALLAERREDARAEQEARAELERLRQEARRWQRPTEALTPEQAKEVARRELAQFLQEQEEAKLPPEQRAFLQEKRAFERQQAEFRQKQEEEQAQRQQAAEAQQRQQAVSNVQAALKYLGSDESDALTLDLVCREFALTTRDGKQYTPDVIARRVQRQLDGMATKRAAKLGPKALLGNPEFLAALNSLDDADLLKALGPLGERLRTLNLQARGITTQQAAAQPSNVIPLPAGQQPRTDTEWIQHFRATGAPDASNATAHAKFWTLKDRGVL